MPGLFLSAIVETQLSLVTRFVRPEQVVRGIVWEFARLYLFDHAIPICHGTIFTDLPKNNVRQIADSEGKICFTCCGI